VSLRPGTVTSRSQRLFSPYLNKDDVSSSGFVISVAVVDRNVRGRFTGNNGDNTGYGWPPDALPR
jgi:hypothetical protein